MRAGVVGQVVESRSPRLNAGDLVTGAFGWQDYAATPASSVTKIAGKHALPDYLGVLGNLFELVARQIRMEGFLAFSFLSHFDEARREIEAWMAAGLRKSYVDVQEGFENIPKTFLRLFRGDNIGKQVLKIADPA